MRRLGLRGLRTSRLRMVQVLLSSQELIMEHWYGPSVFLFMIYRSRD